MLKLLVVDDSRAVHAFLKSCLPQLIGSAKALMNGQEAVDLFASGPQNFDLILLDWEMPILDGPSTVQKLRAAGVTAPILVMTTRNSVEDITRMIELGANEYMFKPFTKDILLEKMSIALNGPVTDAA